MRSGWSERDTERQLPEEDTNEINKVLDPCIHHKHIIKTLYLMYLLSFTIADQQLKNLIFLHDVVDLYTSKSN